MQPELTYRDQFVTVSILGCLLFFTVWVILSPKLKAAGPPIIGVPDAYRIRKDKGPAAA
jgi:hypothetical protein